MQHTVAEAESLKATNPAEAESILKTILDTPSKNKDEAILKEKELAVASLGALYRDHNDTNALAQVVRASRTLMEQLAKAKTAKLIRTLLDFFAAIPNSSEIQVQVTKENIEWAKQEKRIFLKQNLETRLVSLHIQNTHYADALALINSLLRELKKLDDKMVLTEVHLLESKVHLALFNLPKSKAALTSARTAANSIYCPPLLQSQLDMQSGILHAQDKDYKTAFSYFFEALEGFSSQEDPTAKNALKYMLLCKIMLNLPDEVAPIISSKLAQQYAGSDVDAMRKVAKALEDRSLADFESLTKEYKTELNDDPIVHLHLSALYDTLLEQNLMRIIEPFSRVEIAHIAKVVKQPIREVEAKLSQMILDKVLDGILDQGAGCLIVYDEAERDELYDTSLETISQMSQIVDLLFQRTKSTVV